jgi:hypothetical protein
LQVIPGYCKLCNPLQINASYRELLRFIASYFKLQEFISSYRQVVIANYCELSQEKFRYRAPRFLESTPIDVFPLAVRANETEHRY